MMFFKHLMEVILCFMVNITLQNCDFELDICADATPDALSSIKEYEAGINNLRQGAVSNYKNFDISLVSGVETIQDKSTVQKITQCIDSLNNINNKVILIVSDESTAPILDKIKIESLIADGNFIQFIGKSSVNYDTINSLIGEKNVFVPSAGADLRNLYTDICQKKQNCNVPSNLPGSLDYQTVCADKRQMQKCPFTCTADGFRKEGQSLICEDGLSEWGGTAQCIKYCTRYTPNPTSNIIVKSECLSENIGEECNDSVLSCADGYLLKGKVVCTDANTWTNDPIGEDICRPWCIIAYDPNFLNYAAASISSCVQKGVGFSCDKLSCNNGYKLYKLTSENVSCSGPNTWNTPEGMLCKYWCEAVYSPGFDYYDEESVSSCKQSYEGTICSVKCIDGYKMNNPSQEKVKCSGNETWDTPEGMLCKPWCETAYTPPFDNYDISSVSRCVGEDVDFTCDQLSCKDGYKMNNPTQKKVKCSDANTWSTPSDMYCQPWCETAYTPPFDNYDEESVSRCEQSSEGTICSVKCIDGYIMNNPTQKEVKCSGSETWDTPSDMLCIRVCTSSPNIENSNSSENCKNIQTGKICKLTCNTGFIRHGKYPVCIAGNWSTSLTFCSLPQEEPTVFSNLSSTILLPALTVSIIFISAVISYSTVTNYD